MEALESVVERFDAVVWWAFYCQFANCLKNLVSSTGPDIWNFPCIGVQNALRWGLALDGLVKLVLVKDYGRDFMSITCRLLSLLAVSWNYAA
jgi:hypothetical protein